MSLCVGFDGRGVGPAHRRFGSVFNSPRGQNGPYLATNIALIKHSSCLC